MEIINLKDYEIHYFNDGCPTLIFIKKTKSIFEKDSIEKVITGENAIFLFELFKNI